MKLRKFTLFIDSQPIISDMSVKVWTTPLLQAYFSTIWIHFKYGGLTRVVTGSFTLDVIK